MKVSSVLSLAKNFFSYRNLMGSPFCSHQIGASHCKKRSRHSWKLVRSVRSRRIDAWRKRTVWSSLDRLVNDALRSF